MPKRNTIRIVGISIITLTILLIAYHHALISYGVQQAKGQLKIIFNAVPIEEVLANPNSPDSLYQKIELVQAAKSFAVTHVGLEPTKNYSTYYDQQGEVSLWNLSASEKYALEPKLWFFPFLGSFPYKGFFEFEQAKKEFAALTNQGYDARIRPVGGWSTLGWTKDPILSSMLERPEGALVELIIHELTHTTLFIEDDIDFNENLASFIGEQGARDFLEKKYGKNSIQRYDYIFGEEDAITFREHMLLGTQKLDSLYGTFHENMPSTTKSQLKSEMIRAIFESIDTLHFHNSQYYELFQDSLPNNAYFLSYRRYYSAKDSLKQLLSENYHSDLKSFVQGMVEYHSR